MANMSKQQEYTVALENMINKELSLNTE